jgi:hypothetical protein
MEFNPDSYDWLNELFQPDMRPGADLQKVQEVTVMTLDFISRIWPACV